jgi:hypothetical protein
MHCSDCKMWGNGDGTGVPYDAGHVNYCKHPQINGWQHPSYGACGEPTSMVIVIQDMPQDVMTRGKFGCVLFEQRK